MELRRTRKLGARRLQNELQRLYGLSLSTRTIHKVLKQAQVKPLRKTRRIRKGKRRYQKDIPGERVQMDVCKIAPKIYQYIDLQVPDLLTQLRQWQDYYNRERQHGSINQTPWPKWETLKALTSTPEEVQRIYGLKTERIRDAHLSQRLWQTP